MRNTDSRIEGAGRSRTPNDVPAEVLEAARGGDRRAVEEVLDACMEFSRAFLCRMVGNDADLDDLHQTVLLEIVRSLHRFRQASRLSTWVGGIVVNVARQHFREQRARRNREADVPAPDRPAFGAEQLEAGVELQRCSRALDRLSDAQRVVFVLRTVHGYSIKEIAAMTGSAVSTTRLRLYYGRRAFARAYGRIPR